MIPAEIREERRVAGENFRALRQRFSGFSLAKIADAVGVSPMRILRIERGEGNLDNDRIGWLLAERVYGVSWEDVLKPGRFVPRYRRIEDLPRAISRRCCPGKTCETDLVLKTVAPPLLQAAQGAPVGYAYFRENGDQYTPTFHDVLDIDDFLKDPSYWWRGVTPADQLDR